MTDLKAELPSSPDNSIRGDIMLGIKDPRTLTEEVFNSSSELLYHGSASEFVYSSAGEFDQVVTSLHGSHDFGSGFYLTDDLKQAENYSLERSYHDLKRPIIYRFLPYQAKMLDVRALDDPFYNGKLPRKFVEEWVSYLENFLNDEKNFLKYNEFLKEAYQKGIRIEFLERIKKALERNQEVLIRSDHDRGYTGIFQSSSNGFVAPIFNDFMFSKGYDGMIYREGGEGQRREALTGYVFYNPRAVDTFEGWQKRVV